MQEKASELSSAREQRTKHLIERMARGDGPAFDEMVRLWDETFLALGYRLLGDVHEAEDVRQVAWMRIQDHRRKLADVGSPSSWMFQVLINLCRDRIRHFGRSGSLESHHAESEGLEERLAAPQLTPAARLEVQESRDAVAQAVAGLPAPLRECIVLRHYHGQSVSQIAAIVGRPRTTVHTHLTRSLEQLARTLGHLRDEDRTVPQEPPRPCHEL